MIVGRETPQDHAAVAAVHSAAFALPDFDKLDAAEETRFLPGTGSYHGYGSGQTLVLPH